MHAFSSKTLISIVGPTGVGKTALSLALAQQWNTEIVSCDSRQFYKYMDIGTAKATAAERALVKHHFLDFLLPDAIYNAGQFEADCGDLLKQLFAEKDKVVLVGGSTLYAHGLWHGMDEMPDIPAAIRAELNQLFEEKGLTALQTELEKVDNETYQTIDRNNHIRIIRALEVYRTSGIPISVYRKRAAKITPYQNLKIGLERERTALYAIIDARVEKMIAEGLVQEVENLLARGYAANLASMQAIGYAEIVDYLEGKSTLSEAISLIQQHSRNYAKRQLTFFRREKDMIWLSGGLDEMVEEVNKALKSSTN